MAGLVWAGFDSASPYFPNVQTSRTDQKLMNMGLKMQLGW